MAAAHLGVFFNVGQCCCAGTRLYVQEGIYEKFVERMVEKAQARVLGDPFDPKTTHGPQVMYYRKPLYMATSTYIATPRILLLLLKLSFRLTPDVRYCGNYAVQDGD